MPPLVLVVDDDDVLRDVLATVLTQAGYAVAVAATGREALEQFIAQPPQLILLDITLPDLSGTQIFAVLSRADFRTPVLFISALPRSAAGPLAQRAAGYLAKPFELDLLLA